MFYLIFTVTGMKCGKREGAHENVWRWMHEMSRDFETILTRFCLSVSLCITYVRVFNDFFLSVATNLIALGL